MSNGVRTKDEIMELLAVASSNIEPQKDSPEQHFDRAFKTASLELMADIRDRLADIDATLRDRPLGP